MLTTSQLAEIARETLDRMQRLLDGEALALWSYRCQNDVQDFDRLAFHTQIEGRPIEVQINRIRHANGWHYHATDMTSYMLRGGYTWHLRQAGASEPIELYASQGSIIRMGPNDEHRIPSLDVSSISLCVFEAQTAWHQHYPCLPWLMQGYLIGAAVEPLQEVAACG